MHRFDYSFLKGKISYKLVGTSNLIHELNYKENIRKIQYKDAFKSLNNKAIIESIKGSNAIEGIVTTDERIKRITNGAVPISHDEKEISGYKDALNIIHKNNNKLDINEKNILALHKIMEQEANPNEAGHYKTKDNFIMESDEDGNRKIRFTPTKAKEVKESMEQLLLAYYDARQDSEIIDLFLIPCVILDFLCIQPFLDGNGRISRLLSILLLYHAGYDIGKYISLEKQINNYKNEYYNALAQSSKSWHTNNNDYEPFIIFFLQILYKSYKELDNSFIEVSLKKAKKNERIKYILDSAITPISKAEISDKLPDVSIKTIELTLSKLIKDNKIIKIGTFKDAKYIKK